MRKHNCIECGKPTTRTVTTKVIGGLIERELPNLGFRESTYVIYLCSRKCENLFNKPTPPPPPKKIDTSCGSCGGTGKIKGYTCCSCDGAGKKWKMV